MNKNLVFYYQHAKSNIPKNSFWTSKLSQNYFFLRTKKFCAKIIDAKKINKPCTRNKFMNNAKNIYINISF